MIKKKRRNFFASLCLISVLFASVFAFPFISARVSLSEDSEGNLVLSLNDGELIPTRSEIVFEDTNGNIYNYNLSNLISGDVILGDYYIEEILISGNGDGFGIAGESISYPEVEFNLRVISLMDESDGFQQTENPTDETSSETSADETSTDEIIEEETEVPEEFSEREENQTKETVEVENGNSSNTNVQIEGDDSGLSTSENDVEQGEMVEDNAEEIVDEEDFESPTDETSSETSADETSTDEIIEEETETSPVAEESTSSSQSESIESTESVSETESSKSSESTEPIEPSEDSEKTAPITGNVVGDSGGRFLSKFFGMIFNFFRSLNLTMTGQVVLHPGSEISGSVSSNEEIVYNLGPDTSVEVVPGSVNVNGKILSENFIDLRFEDGNVFVTTNYHENEKGFGQEFLGSNVNKFTISLPEEISTEIFDVSVVYDDIELVSLNNVAQDYDEVIEVENETGSLTEFEKNLLIEEFGSEDVKVSIREEEKYDVVRYEIGNYWYESSYSKLASLEKQNVKIEESKNRWLKDIVKKISKVKSNN